MSFLSPAGYPELSPDSNLDYTPSQVAVDIMKEPFLLTI